MSDKPETPPPSRLRQWLQQTIPSPDSLAGNRWLQPIAHRLLAPALWCNAPEPVARGVAIGIFWAFVVPVAQIPLALLHCVAWRANIPAAAMATLVTNPLTLGFWLWLAYRFGSLFVNAPLQTESDLQVPATGLLNWLLTVGWPVVVGMGCFALGGALLGYALVRSFWLMHRWLVPHNH